VIDMIMCYPLVNKNTMTLIKYYVSDPNVCCKTDVVGYCKSQLYKVHEKVKRWALIRDGSTTGY